MMHGQTKINFQVDYEFGFCQDVISSLCRWRQHVTRKRRHLSTILRGV